MSFVGLSMTVVVPAWLPACRLNGRERAFVVDVRRYTPLTECLRRIALHVPSSRLPAVSGVVDTMQLKVGVVDGDRTALTLAEVEELVAGTPGCEVLFTLTLPQLLREGGRGAVFAPRGGAWPRKQASQRESTN